MTGRTLPRGWTVAVMLVVAILVAPASGAAASGSTTFTLSAEELSATADVRRAAGYGHGPEGVLGVVPNRGSGQYTFLGANGIATGYGFSGRAGKFTGTLARPFATDPPGAEGDDKITMANTPATMQFTAPSKIYEVPGRPRVPAHWLTVVQSQRYYRNLATGELNQSNGYYATLGMAKSTNRGATWTYLGEIIRHRTTFAQCVSAGNISAEVGSGPWVIVKVHGVDYFYSYFFDKQTPACGFQNHTDLRLLAVARAKVSDVIAAAGKGKTTRWVKYNGRWGTEPGLGGRSSDIATGDDWDPSWYDVSYNTYVRKFILISTGCRVKPARNVSRTGDLCWMDSKDGLNWSPISVILDFGTTFNIYPTIVGLGQLPGRVSGRSFFVYYLKATVSPTLWSEGSLWRVKVTVTAPQP